MDLKKHLRRISSSGGRARWNGVSKKERSEIMKGVSQKRKVRVEN